MTEAQRKRFYFPAWRDCQIANDWVLVGGRLACDREKNQALSDMHYRIWRECDAMALRKHTAILPDYFRHAVNAVVNGGKTSSKDLRESWRVNHAVLLFRALANPTVDTMVAYLSPGVPKREGILVHMDAIHSPGYWEKVCLQIFDTRDWRNLDDERIAYLLAKEKGWRSGKKPEVKTAIATSRREEPKLLIVDDEGVKPENIPW